MCRTPSHQQEQDSIDSRVAAFLRCGGAIQRLDNHGEVVGVATEDLPCLPESSPEQVMVQDVPEELPVLACNVVPDVAAVGPPDTAQDADIARMVAVLRDIRRVAKMCLQQLERAVERGCV